MFCTFLIKLLSNYKFVYFTYEQSFEPMTSLADQGLASRDLNNLQRVMDSKPFFPMCRLMVILVKSKKKNPPVS